MPYKSFSLMLPSFTLVRSLGWEVRLSHESCNAIYGLCSRCEARWICQKVDKHHEETLKSNSCHHSADTVFKKISASLSRIRVSCTTCILFEWLEGRPAVDPSDQPLSCNDYSSSHVGFITVCLSLVFLLQVTCWCNVIAVIRRKQANNPFLLVTLVL